MGPRTQEPSLRQQKQLSWTGACVADLLEVVPLQHQHLRQLVVLHAVAVWLQPVVVVRLLLLRTLLQHLADSLSAWDIGFR